MLSDEGGQRDMEKRARRYQWAAVLTGIGWFFAYGPVILAENQGQRLAWLAVAIPLQVLSFGLFIKAKRAYPDEEASIRVLLRDQPWRWQTTVLVVLLVALVAFITIAIVSGLAPRPE